MLMESWIRLASPSTVTTEEKSFCSTALQRAPSTMYQSEYLFNKSNVTASTAFLKKQSDRGEEMESERGKNKKIY